MTLQYSLLALSLLFCQIFCWEALPEIPSGRRSQFLVLHENGGYKYGYDTGDGSAAKQSADSSNQVSGHYFYKNSLGQDVDLKYTAGVQGFVPEGYEKFLPRPDAPVAPAVPQTRLSSPVAPPPQHSSPVASQPQHSSPVASQPQHSSSVASEHSSSTEEDEEPSGDASYSFTIDTDTYKRQEVSDARGNIQGSYSYTNEAGVHNLKYTAGENAGFVASGSLSPTNGLKVGQSLSGAESYSSQNTYSQSSESSVGAQNRYNQVSKSSGNTYGQRSDTSVGAQNRYNQVSKSSEASPVDGSYSFSYSVGDSAREESADANNNVQGKYSYRNEAGNHDLSYVAGSKTGFVVTGGSLAQLNGLTGQSSFSSSPAQAASKSHSAGSKSSFASSPVQTVAKSSFGSHSTVSKSSDSLFGSKSSSAPSPVQAVPKSSFGSHSAVSKSSDSYSSAAHSTVNSANADGSFSFSYSVGDSSREEQADAANNVQGKYSYQNEAGSHDLSYVAGAKTGFLVTGGSLAQPNGLSQSGASKSFTFNQASAPTASSYASQQSQGYQTNIRNSFTADYQKKSHSAPTPSSYTSKQSQDDQANTGDSSYSFTIDTADYQRKESSDASGNVQGSYSYKNSAGTHDLSYIAGAQTGFLPTGGSLFNSQTTANSVSSSVPELAKSSVSEETQDDLANTGDSSYSFSIDTDDYKRTESSDANGNIQGSYSYKNEAGTHDLSYVAGSSTGFVATGGSLSNPDAIASKIASLPYNKQSVPVSSPKIHQQEPETHITPSKAANLPYGRRTVPQTQSSSSLSYGRKSVHVPSPKNQQASETESTGDASYSFSIDTDDYKRQEVSDANGNIQDSFSYKNSVGNHDLAFVAGSATGFRPTSGSLQTVPGLSVDQLNAGSRSSSAKNSALQSARRVNNVASSRNANAYSEEKAVVHSYLPPSNDKKKFGYIYDTA